VIRTEPHHRLRILARQNERNNVEKHIDIKVKGKKGRTFTFTLDAPDSAEPSVKILLPALGDKLPLNELDRVVTELKRQADDQNAA